MFPTYHAINLPKISQACSCIIPLKVKEKKHKSFWLIDVSKSQWDPLQFPKESIVLSKSSKSCPPQRTINLNKFGSLLDSPPKKCTSQIEQSSHVATSKNMFFLVVESFSHVIKQLNYSSIVLFINSQQKNHWETHLCQVFFVGPSPSP